MAKPAPPLSLHSKRHGLDTANGERRVGLDILRIIAILIVLSVHLTDYVRIPFLPAIAPYLAAICMGLFTFLSGYLLGMQKKTIARNSDIAAFLYRRSLRIYPKYLVALGAFVILSQAYPVFNWIHIRPFPSKLIIHAVGAQMLFEQWQFPIMTLWYVGLILLLYVCFSIIERVSTSPRSFLAGALVLLCVCALLRHLLGLFGNRFFMYYPAFVVGVLAGKADIFSNTKARPWILSVAFIVAAVTSLLLWRHRGGSFDMRGLHYGEFPFAEGARILFMLSSVLLLGSAVAYAPARTPSRARSLISLLAATTYSVFLFHRPVLAPLTYGLTRLLGAASPLLPVLVPTIGLPLVFLVGFGIDRIGQSLRGALSGRLRGRAGSSGVF